MACGCKKEEHEESFEGQWYEFPVIRNAGIAGIITGITFLLAHISIIPSFVEIALFVGAIALGGYHWIKEGIEEIVEEKAVSIDVLMMAATIGAAILGLWDEAAFLVFLYGIAEGVEEFTYSKTRHSIRNLLDLAPKEAKLLIDGKEAVIPANELKIGDIFIVRPGESIPTDGTIVEGRSNVNEAPVTGESMLVEKQEGMKVFAGTFSKDGALIVKTTASFEDNTLSKMIHLVEEAQEQKGKRQLFIERFGAKYSPAVLIAGLLLIAVPPLLGGSMATWAYRAVVLFVAAAPCALIMSTPVAIAAGIGRAGKNGILIKGGIHLENLGKIKAVAFDKTGTLTSGKPVITDAVALNGSQSDLLRIACSIERFSEHPLSKAVVSKGEELKCGILEVKNFEALSGFGVKANLGERTVFIGKPELFKELDLRAEDQSKIDQFRSEGKTVMLVGTQEKIDGIIAVRDEVRPHSREVVEQLHSMKIHIVMLTGDNEVTAKAIAGELGIEEVKANLKPEDKISAVKELKQKYRDVAMVGDGINDAPALAESTVGMALGTAGTDEAIEAADIALMADDLTKIPYAIQLGRKAQRIGGQNIVFSLVLLAVLIPLSVLGLIGVALAVIVHEGSEIAAVLNGLRIQRLRIEY
ncbi:MAG: heavy metal translocating P-type ATPase [Elusimicrobiota bacterium]